MFSSFSVFWGVGGQSIGVVSRGKRRKDWRMEEEI